MINSQQILSNIVVFVVILVVGIPVSGFLGKVLCGVLKSSKVDGVISGFVSSLVKGISVFVVVILAISKLLTADLGPIIASIGAVIVGFSLILKDYISNAVSGTVILANKPFTIGDIIEIGSTTGEVISMNFLSTRVLTISGKTVTIPNFKLVNENVTSYKKSQDIPFSINYTIKDNVQLKDFLEKYNMLQLDPSKASVFISGASADCINFTVNVCCNFEKYQEVSKKIQDCLRSTLGLDEKSGNEVT